jgi:hypothetical protein
MNNTNITAVNRPCSGRTKGSFSFVKVPLSALCGKFADTETPVVISRKWAEQVGFTNLVANPANATLDSIQGQTPLSKIQATVVELD